MGLKLNFRVLFGSGNPVNNVAEKASMDIFPRRTLLTNPTVRKYSVDLWKDYLATV